MQQHITLSTSHLSALAQKSPKEGKQNFQAYDGRCYIDEKLMFCF